MAPGEMAAVAALADLPPQPDGLPESVPPRHVDRNQTPLVNTRIQAALTRYGEAA